VEERIELQVPSLYDSCCRFLIEQEKMFPRRYNRSYEEEGIGKRAGDNMKQQPGHQSNKTCCECNDADDSPTENDRERTEEENKENLGAEMEEDIEECELYQWECILPIDIRERLRLDYQHCANPCCPRQGFFGNGRVRRRFVERKYLMELSKHNEPTPLSSGAKANRVSGDIWVCWSCRLENSNLLSRCALCLEERQLLRSSSSSIRGECLQPYNKQSKKPHASEGQIKSSASSLSSSTTTKATLILPAKNTDMEEEEQQHEIAFSFCSTECAAVLGRFLTPCLKKRSRTRVYSQLHQVPARPCTTRRVGSGLLSLDRAPEF